MPRIIAGATVGFAKVVSFIYSGLGMLALVLGIGLLAEFWTLKDIGGGVIDWALDPGWVMRLILPFVLALRYTRESSALFLIVLGGCHLLGGATFLLGWKIGRFLLVTISGFYVVLLLIMIGRTLLLDYHRALPPAAFLALHAVCLWTYLSRAVADWVK